MKTRINSAICLFKGANSGGKANFEWKPKVKECPYLHPTDVYCTHSPGVSIPEKIPNYRHRFNPSFLVTNDGPLLSLIPWGCAGLSREFDLFILFTTWRINCSGGLYSYSWERTDCFQRFADCGRSLGTTGESFGFLWMYTKRWGDCRKSGKLKRIAWFNGTMKKQPMESRKT